MSLLEAERVIRGQVVVDASLDEVWEAWTTPEGVKSFFGPDCKIDLRVEGAYEIYFDLDAPPGQLGGEGVVILAFQLQNFLSFTWNAPPELGRVRNQHTHVTLRLAELDKEQTRVTLKHDGWGEGREWDAAYDYFVRAWLRVVLPRLQYRFKYGPIDWNNLPQLDPL